MSKFKFPAGVTARNVLQVLRMNGLSAEYDMLKKRAVLGGMSSISAHWEAVRALAPRLSSERVALPQVEAKAAAVHHPVVDPPVSEAMDIANGPVQRWQLKWALMHTNDTITNPPDSVCEVLRNALVNDKTNSLLVKIIEKIGVEQQGKSLEDDASYKLVDLEKKLDKAIQDMTNVRVRMGKAKLREGSVPQSFAAADNVASGLLL